MLSLTRAIVLAVGLAMSGTGLALNTQSNSGIGNQQSQIGGTTQNQNTFGNTNQNQSQLGNNPQSGSTFGNTTNDLNSGNRYRTTPNSQGGTTTRGHNPSTGSTWTNRSDGRGNQSGIDSDGNRWQYNNSTGTYRNFGTGETRQHGR